MVLNNYHSRLWHHQNKSWKWQTKNKRQMRNFKNYLSKTNQSCCVTMLLRINMKINFQIIIKVQIKIKIKKNLHLKRKKKSLRNLHQNIVKIEVWLRNYSKLFWFKMIWYHQVLHNNEQKMLKWTKLKWI